jgi:DNA-binding transcriptional ArsR family regulator
VSAVIAATGLSQTNVSFHLRTLREAGLVRGEPNGPFVFYCLADPTLLSHRAPRTVAGGAIGLVRLDRAERNG